MTDGRMRMCMRTHSFIRAFIHAFIHSPIQPITDENKDEDETEGSAGLYPNLRLGPLRASCPRRPSFPHDEDEDEDEDEDGDGGL